MAVTSLRALAAAVAVTVLTGTGAHAQSLGDAAKQEESRRKTVKEPAKVLTNKDLGAVSPPPVAPAPAEAAGQAAPAPAAADAAKADATKADAGKPDQPAKDQKYWSGRLKDLQTQIDRDQTLADAMQTRINSLTNDFAARSDPAQRAVIEADRKKSIAELSRLTDAIKTDKKALGDFQEEARKAAVPPGWLR